MRKYLVLLLLSAIGLMTEAQNTGNIYRILCYNNKALCVTNNGSTDNDAIVVLGDTLTDENSQLWMYVAPDGVEGGFSLYNLKSGRNIDMAPKANPAWRLLQWDADFSSDNQKFTIHSPGIAGSAMQFLMYSDNSRVMTVHSDSTLWMDQDLSNTDTYFQLEQVKGVTDITKPFAYVTYQIISKKFGTVLSNRKSKDNDALIYSDVKEDENAAQEWYLKPFTTKYGTYYQLYNSFANKSIDAAVNDGVSKGPLQWTTSTSTNDNQLFTITEADTDVYRISVGKWTESTGTVNYYIASSEDGSTYMTTDEADENTLYRMQGVVPTVVIKKVEWQNSLVYEINKEAGHATYIPYQSTEVMRGDARYEKAWLDAEKSTRYMTLDGTWKLLWGEVPEDLTLPGEEAYGDDVDATSWSDIKVPGCLEMQGYGTPYYVNVDYPFSDNPPYIQMKSGIKNTVATYRRDFQLPEGWDKERTLLHFDGAYSCLYVYVNGQSVGYSEGANNDAEFDVTPYVRSGNNNITVQVIRFTDASYLEDQDMWRMSGLHRDVYMVSVPKTFVRDHIITSELNDAATEGTMNVRLSLDNRDGIEVSKQYSVSLISPDGQQIAAKTETTDFTQTDTEKSLTFTFEGLTDLKPWTADSPTLYTIEVSQKTAEGSEEEVFSTKYGFVTAKIDGVQFKVNGRRTFLKGVNTQDTDPVYGRTMSIDAMWKDLTMMKQANVNCVRTSHYPRQPRMLAMMDYLGLYQMDEADVEFHKNWSDQGSIISDSKWTSAIVDREVRMVQRDRNHPSVVIWSMGNESNDGSNFTAAYSAIRNLDARPIHYEGCTNAGSWTGNSDIDSYMYRDVPTMQNRCSNATRPVFMCEYAHAMGNSVGNLQEYWDVFEASKSSMGGAIWDWVDQAIYSPEDVKAGNFKTNGFNRWRNGNDYPVIGQGNFVNNGIITADRMWTGKLDEVRRVYQYVKFGDLKNGSVTLKNAYESVNLDEFYICYTVLKDGAVQQSGTVEIPSTKPDASATVSIPYTAPDAGDEAEYLLNLSVCLKDAQSWADAQYAVAQHQYTLKERSSALPAVTETGTALVYDEAAGIISNDKVCVKVKKTGTVAAKGVRGIQLCGVELLAGDEPVAHSNYRWIENDAPYGTDPSYDTGNGISGRSITITMAEDGQTCTIKDNSSATSNTWTNYTYLYTVYANGTVDMEVTYKPKSNNVSARRMGVGMLLNSELTNTTYYARGPRSNTVDRKTGSDLGIYTLPVREYHVDYVKPQTSADRQDLRYLNLYNTEGNGIRIETEGQVNFSLDNYDDAYMHGILHQWEMDASTDIYAHFDYMQRGIGNGSCGAGVLDKYKVPTSGTYTYKLRFTPLSGFEPTGIVGLDTDNEASAQCSLMPGQPVFTVSGQLAGNTSALGALPKGTYVSCGHKFVVK